LTIPQFFKINGRIIIVTRVGGRLEQLPPDFRRCQPYSHLPQREENKMIKIMARISSQSGAESSMRDILQDLVGPSRNEAGCQSYELFQDEENPLEFVTIEHWAEQAAADAHMATPHVAAAIAKAAPLLAQPPVIHRYTQLA